MNEAWTPASVFCVALQVPISEIYEKIPTDNFRKSFLFPVTSPEAGISKNYWATNLGSFEVELRFCLWLTFF